MLRGNGFEYDHGDIHYSIDPFEGYPLVETLKPFAVGYRLSVAND